MPQNERSHFINPIGKQIISLPASSYQPRGLPIQHVDKDINTFFAKDG